jgi:hypothetical protein
MNDGLHAAPAVFIELLYWPGCPSHPQARALLERLMHEHQLEPGTLAVRVIATDDEAQAEQFPGSPTIRVNRCDVVESREPASLSCRLYRRRDGRASALPDPQDIRDALAEALRARR